MANPLTLSRAWRILKEVNLEAIRREAETPVRVVIVAETTADADDLAVLLSGGHPAAARWLLALDAELAAHGTGGRAGARPGALDAELAVVLTRGTEISGALDAARRDWHARGVRLVQIAIASGERHGKTRVVGRVARVTLDALDVDALDLVAEAVFAVVRPDQRLALARVLPALRPRLFHDLVSETARANAGYAFSTGLAETIPVLDVPLNIGDMVVLTKNQLVMAYRLALAAGKNGQPRELIGEIVGVLGGGLLFRQAARSLVGLLPVIGIVPKVAVAYGGTWAIGRAVILWATEGRRLTKERLKALTREGLERGREIARSMRQARS